MSCLALLCGSLRHRSLNAAALEALARRVPADVATTTLRVNDLPLFNPDLEDLSSPDLLPPAVARLRRQVASADALVIAAPEYARGVSSVAKTALDWMVGEETCAGKPTLLVNASPRAAHAQSQMREILATMAFRVVEPASLVLPLLGRAWTADEILDDPAMTAAIDAAINALRASLLV
jgi:NAD(P)H-dependent FMN reductase